MWISLFFSQLLEFSSRLCRMGFTSGFKFFYACIYSLSPFPLGSHLPLLLPCPSLSSPVYGFLLQFHISVVQFFLLFCCLLSPFYNPNLFPVSLHPCPVLPLQASSLLCSHCCVRPGHPWREFLLSSLCSAQHQVTHRTRQGFILHSAGTEPGHRGSISHVFLHLWQAKKSKVKRMGAEPRFNTALGPAESLWGSATKLPPLWKRRCWRESPALSLQTQAGTFHSRQGSLGF